MNTYIKTIRALSGVTAILIAAGCGTISRDPRPRVPDPGPAVAADTFTTCSKRCEDAFAAKTPAILLAETQAINGRTPVMRAAAQERAIRLREQAVTALYLCLDNCPPASSKDLRVDPKTGRITRLTRGVRATEIIEKHLGPR